MSVFLCPLFKSVSLFLPLCSICPLTPLYVASLALVLSGQEGSVEIASLNWVALHIYSLFPPDLITLSLSHSLCLSRSITLSFGLSTDLEVKLPSVLLLFTWSFHKPEHTRAKIKTLSQSLQQPPAPWHNQETLDNVQCLQIVQKFTLSHVNVKSHVPTRQPSVNQTHCCDQRRWLHIYIFI